MEEWSYTSTHPVGHTGSVKGKLYFYLFLLTFLTIVSKDTKTIK